jgi:hypothetical protein
VTEAAKDYIEHLRTTHFSLILTCFGLFAASFIARSSNESALPELREILTALEDTTKTFPEHFLLDRVRRSWTMRFNDSVVLLPVASLWYREFDRWMPLQHRLAKRPKTLNDFSVDWNELHAQPLVRIGATEEFSDETGVYYDVVTLAPDSSGSWKESTETVYPSDPRERLAESSPQGGPTWATLLAHGIPEMRPASIIRTCRAS